ncbi:DALR domain-containing protein [Francisella tularensis]
MNLPDDASEYEEIFIIAIDNDFNTPEALAVLFSLDKDINTL